MKLILTSSRSALVFLLAATGFSLVACASVEDDAGAADNDGAGGSGGAASGGQAAAAGGTGGSGLGASSNGSGGTGGTDALGEYCDAESKDAVPFAVSEKFIASGYMGDGADITMTADICPDRPDGAEGACYVVEYTPAGPKGWAGVVWQYPQDNWGTAPGACVAAGATKVVFQAKGAVGGEVVGFGAAGSETGDLTLTANWAEYEIELTDAYNTSGDSGGVVAGFNWAGPSVNGAFTFYLDDIRWVNE